MQSASQFGHWDAAGRYVALRTRLWNWSLTAFVFGGLAILAAVLLPQFQDSKIGMLGLGGVLVALGILMRFKVNYWLFVIACIVMIALGGWLIRAAILANQAISTKATVSQIAFGFGIIMIGGSLINLWHNRRYRSFSGTTPPAELLNWLDSTLKTIKMSQEQALDLIYFTDDRRSNEKSSIWHGRLDPEKITLVYKYGEKFLFLDRSRFMLQLGPPATLSDIKGMVPLALIRNGNKAQITLNQYQCEGLSNQVSFNRFVAWQQLGR